MSNRCAREFRAGPLALRSRALSSRVRHLGFSATVQANPRVALAARGRPCMMAAMSEWNFMTVIIVIALFALWKLEFAATLLNLKAFPESVPAELDDVLDAAKCDQARDYLRVNSHFDVIKSCFSLALLLVFWFAGGFAWLHGQARALGPRP